MATPSHQAIIDVLLRDHGRSYAHEAGIRIERNTPAVLFQLLYLALMLSARISAANATRAAKALIDAGLTTPDKMLAASWQDRVDVITSHGYKRYDESTATMLGEAAQRVLDEYDGDLRKLRDAGDREPAREHELLREFKGIGPVGADIFLREVQVVWDEVYPYADERVLEAARKLDLAGDPRVLSDFVERDEFARLTAALIRVDLADAYAKVREAAARG